MGIDEILLDMPAPDAALSMSDLTSSEKTSQAGISTAGSSQAGEATSQASAPASPETAALETAVPETAVPVDTAVPHPASTPDLSASLAGITDLEGLRDALVALDSCALKHTASNLIFADGNPGARLMVVGDVPGRDEDRVGLPLVGADGQLLDRMLASIGLSRADIYIVPLIPWRPPGNRTPTAEEMALLLPFLYRHVQLAAPEMILLLGGVTAKTMLPPGGGILKLRGRWHDIDYGDGTARPTLATLHPAYLSRSPAQKRLAFADLVALAGKLG
jgi:DNA polymerase